ncbi:archaemetzincin family Zn-dependent metalloprotease [Candidatus Bathyarchaeota archaeon]|nr:archaemetzincin family Zn-dependent metalloprotease [Candidatus Bathyarchaeota archaeon]
MIIGILRVGPVDAQVLERIRENLNITFPSTKPEILQDMLSIPKHAFNAKRGQYRSNIILAEVRLYAERARNLSKVLGVADVDLFVSGLNFVFGEAECPGRAALISIWRLRPEFYGEKPNFERLAERSVKEAVHELGHTFGLGHCRNPYCVMYFSNTILDTDRKQSLFCSKCKLKIQGLLEAEGADRQTF